MYFVEPFFRTPRHEIGSNKYFNDAGNYTLVRDLENIPPEVLERIKPKPNFETPENGYVIKCYKDESIDKLSKAFSLDSFQVLCRSLGIKKLPMLNNTGLRANYVLEQRSNFLQLYFTACGLPDLVLSTERILASADNKPKIYEIQHSLAPFNNISILESGLGELATEKYDYPLLLSEAEKFVSALKVIKKRNKRNHLRTTQEREKADIFTLAIPDLHAGNIIIEPPGKFVLFDTNHWSEVSDSHHFEHTKGQTEDCIELLLFLIELLKEALGTLKK